MRDTALSDLERLGAATADAAVGTDVPLVMDEDAFRLFYERSARPLWAYLARITGDARLADDLLQETYYRFLRARVSPATDDHRRRYLYRIATNLAHDAHARRRIESVPIDGAVEPADPRTTGDAAGRVAARVDIARALSRLKPRERDLLWLAYAQGSSHREIADVLGLRTGSIKLLLFRARRRLAALLGART